MPHTFIHTVFCVLHVQGFNFQDMSQRRLKNVYFLVDETVEEHDYGGKESLPFHLKHIYFEGQKSMYLTEEN